VLADADEAAEVVVHLLERDDVEPAEDFADQSVVLVSPLLDS